MMTAYLPRDLVGGENIVGTFTASGWGNSAQDLYRFELGSQSALVGGEQEVESRGSLFHWRVPQPIDGFGTLTIRDMKDLIRGHVLIPIASLAEASPFSNVGSSYLVPRFVQSGWEFPVL